MRGWNRNLFLTGDGWLLLSTGGVRSFAFGFLSVVLGIYLAALGLDPTAVGVVFMAALGGGAMMTMLLTAVADQLGRRRVLLAGAILMGLSGAVFATTDNLALLIIAAILGTISPSGREVGPFLSVEVAGLSQTTGDRRRTGTFAAYNLVCYLATAVGSLAAGLPSLLGLETLQGYRTLVWAYSAGAVVLVVLYRRLSPLVEARWRPPSPRRLSFGLHRSRGVVIRLAAVLAIDAFAGGFVVQGLVSYWFSLRFGADAAVLGTIFFGVNLLAGLSLLMAAPVARRVGLINTMVFTQLPANVLLLLVPFMPTMGLAAAMLLARSLLSYLDVPIRQSYTMALVDPDERSAAAGLTSVARNAAAALAPALTGATLAVPSLGLPFLLGGGVKIGYNLLLFALFRRLKPPEESASPLKMARGD